MTSAAMPGVYRMTFVDWLQLPHDGRLYELIDGELLVSPSPSILHQRVSRELEFQILQYLRTSGRGEVLDAPVGVRLGDDVLEPDLVIVLSEHADRIGAQVIEGAPDVVVEILSPGTAKRDLGVKRTVYEAAGVPEYWIVDAESAAVEVLVLERGAYVRLGLFRRGDTLRSRVLPDLTVLLAPVFAAK
jgi:Uma2 family endonuclease